VVVSAFIIGDAVDADVWKRLDVVLAAILEQRPGLVLGAVSTPTAPGLVVKLVARSAPRPYCDVGGDLVSGSARSLESSGPELAAVLSQRAPWLVGC
jgi:hypothetical protein